MYDNLTCGMTQVCFLYCTSSNTQTVQSYHLMTFQKLFFTLSEDESASEANIS
jgi:hypothetical protein